MSEQLQQDMTCEGLLECFHGLTQLDKEIFQTLVSAEDSLTVDEIAEVVDRERSTAYRGVQRLLQTDPGQIADNMQRMLNDWYAKMGQLIQKFETRYESKDQSTPPVES